MIKLGLEYECMGEQAVKNIPELIRSYRVFSYPGDASRRAVKTKKASGNKWQQAIFVITALGVVGVGALTLWHFYQSCASSVDNSASIRRMAFPLPDKPAIDVLPFANLNNDSEQD